MQFLHYHLPYTELADLVAMEVTEAAEREDFIERLLLMHPAILIIRNRGLAEMVPMERVVQMDALLYIMEFPKKFPLVAFSLAATFRSMKKKKEWWWYNVGLLCEQIQRRGNRRAA